MAERKPVVLVGGQLQELPAGDTLPPQAPAAHGHATSDVTGLDAALAGKEPAISAGSTAQYWHGDKTWRDFFTDVRAATLTGLSTATNAVISATDTVLGALGKLQKQVSDNLATLTSHTSNTSNPHGVTKSQVGLGSVDNTSDANKPVSSATQTALNTKLDKSGNILATSGALGYGAGSGGSVSQETGKGYGVVLNKPSGVITTHNSELAGNTAIAFIVTNSFVSFTDTVVCNVVGGTGNVNAYIATAFPYHGGFYISLRNMTSTNLTDNVQIRFNTIKGSES